MAKPSGCNSRLYVWTYRYYCTEAPGAIPGPAFQYCEIAELEDAAGETGDGVFCDVPNPDRNINAVAPWGFESLSRNHLWHWCSTVSIPVFQTGGASSNLVCHSTRAFSSAGQSLQLITGWSTVRSREGPPYRCGNSP